MITIAEANDKVREAVRFVIQGDETTTGVINIVMVVLNTYLEI